MTYARARLWLGITGVGTLVTLAYVGIERKWSHSIMHGWGGGFWSDWASLGGLYILYALIASPFDFLGGYWLPCRFGRFCHLFPTFAWAWLRGLLVQGTWMTLSGCLLLIAGRRGGFLGAATAFLAIQVLMLALQRCLAQWVGGMSAASFDLQPWKKEWDDAELTPVRAVALSGHDTGFTGGWAGIPGREVLVVPQHWKTQLSPAALAAQLIRRGGIRATGSRLRGVMLALLWNTAGFWFAAQVPGAGVTTVPEFVSLALGFTVWSFFGLLSLPSLSRPAVFEADRFALDNGVDGEAVKAAAREIDQLNEDEPARRPWVERIFHPIPNVASRIEAVDRGGEPAFGSWHALRLALFLSWPAFNFLNRAVHCNSGRPELWVMLPSD